MPVATKRMEKLRANPIPERMIFLENLASCHLGASSQEPYGALSWRVFTERRMTLSDVPAS
jgi:hypothetical protein